MISRVGQTCSYHNNHSQILAASKQRVFPTRSWLSGECEGEFYFPRAFMHGSAICALFASHGLPSSGAGWVDSNRHFQSVFSFEY